MRWHTHCRIRLLQRYGLRNFTPQEHEALCKRLRADPSLFLAKVPKSNGDFYVEFKYRDRLVKAAWDGKCIRTFLPAYAEPPHRSEAA